QGQTSSGKTYTMGTAPANELQDREQEGIIPRAINALFQRLEAQAIPVLSSPPPSLRPVALPSGIQIPRRSPSTAKLRAVSMIIPPSRRASSSTLSENSKAPRQTVHVSFVEIYNEELIDLLNQAPASERPSVTIREDTKGHIVCTGIKEMAVTSTEDVLKYLQMGTQNRATSATDMNAKSSRSHAIFTVLLKQEKWVPKVETKIVSPVSTPTPSRKPDPIPIATSRSSIISTPSRRCSTLNVKAMVGHMERQAKHLEEEGEWVITNSKFHFVDLAGSERLKRTAAQGDRRKEGIHINAGLLALGNVISALSETPKKSLHVPYRDSKLTRLLQDSLGGNATTLMIACVSPTDSNLTETVNTIKYAHRTRSIKNKSERNETEEWTVNDNPEVLRSIIAKLKSEIRSLRQPSPASSISSISKPSPPCSISDNEPIISCPSSSATTTITVPDVTDFDQQALVADLRRQIEELQNQVTVTRERNRLVERRLHSSSTTATSTDDPNFQHLVEPVIEEYEKSIAGLESHLAMARTALAHSDKTLGDQEAKIVEYESLHAQEQTLLNQLRIKLSRSTDREHSSEAHVIDLEEKLSKTVAEAETTQLILADLKQKISQLKESDINTDQYITTLEERLGVAEEQAKDAETLKKNLQESLARCAQLEEESQRVTELASEVPSEHKIALAAALAKTAELETKVSIKASQVDELEKRLAEIDQLRVDWITLRDTQTAQIQQLEEALNLLRAEHAVCLEELSAARAKQVDQKRMSEQICEALETDNAMLKYQVEEAAQTTETLHKHMWEHEQGTQITLRLRLQELEKVKLDLNALRMVEEKQDIIIRGLEAKLVEMDRLTTGLREQIADRERRVSELEAENQKKSQMAQSMQKEMEGVLRDVCGMGVEKKQLEMVIHFVESTMRIQDAKSDRTFETLKDLRQQYVIREEDLEEKRRTVELLTGQKESLSNVLQEVTDRASKADEANRLLQQERDQAKASLESQLVLIKTLQEDRIQTDIELQCIPALEARVKELDEIIESETKEHRAILLELEKKTSDLEMLNQSLVSQTAKTSALEATVEELRKIIETERALVAANDTSGMISELEERLSTLQKTHRIEVTSIEEKCDRALEDLAEAQKETKDCQDIINALQIHSPEPRSHSLKNLAANLSRSRISHMDRQSYQASAAQKESLREFQEHLSKKLQAPEGQMELIDKLCILSEDNSNLMRHVDDLEGQLVLQRSQLTLEIKNLELEVMKQTAANDRLEKEMEQVIIPRNSVSTPTTTRESIIFTSPSPTPRVSSPTSALPPNMLHYKLQREMSNSSLTKIQKPSPSGYRTIIVETEEDRETSMKRRSVSSIRSDTTRAGSSMMRNRAAAGSVQNLPPPSAPPSNPLPPIPSPLPAVPGSPVPSSPPHSPPMQPTRVLSVSLLRQDSNASSGFSEIMSSIHGDNVTSEQYEKMLRSLQRKSHIAENDVKAHQEVISKLEAQLTRSESSMRDAKKQLDVLNRERQTYALEIQNLRTQVTQIQTHQLSSANHIAEERKALESELEAEKRLKEKAEKARHILENRMEELMNKKNKFMCF
ncbi:hypothetical protein J3Q64DRAFT_1634651, partial [Phycomyces blakesleeanus]